MQAVIDPSGPTVVGFVPENAILVSDFQNFVKVDYPREMDQETLGVESDGQGGFTFVTDPAKVAQKTANQWTQVRAQQKQKLYESDWTCSVSDYEVPNKADWVTYRQALRDVTKQTDPFNIEWPTRPSA
jgi:Phage tail assembly chaperone protein